jgi:hypothetical protein
MSSILTCGLSCFDSQLTELILFLQPYAPVLQPGVEEYDSEASIHSSDEEEEDEATLLKPQ